MEALRHEFAKREESLNQALRDSGKSSLQEREAHESAVASLQATVDALEARLAEADSAARAVAQQALEDMEAQRSAAAAELQQSLMETAERLGGEHARALSVLASENVASLAAAERRRQADLASTVAEWQSRQSRGLLVPGFCAETQNCLPEDLLHSGIQA